MAENTVYPKVILKKKQIPVLIDFCLEESIEFNVKQQNFPNTDWEVELKFKDYKTAIAAGMFLRDNKFEVDGIDLLKYKKNSVNSQKKEDKTESPKAESTSKTSKSDSLFISDTDNKEDISQPSLL